MKKPTPALKSALKSSLKKPKNFSQQDNPQDSEQSEWAGPSSTRQTPRRQPITDDCDENSDTRKFPLKPAHAWVSRDSDFDAEDVVAKRDKIGGSPSHEAETPRTSKAKGSRTMIVSNGADAGPWCLKPSLKAPGGNLPRPLSRGMAATPTNLPSGSPSNGESASKDMKSALKASLHSPSPCPRSVSKANAARSVSKGFGRMPDVDAKSARKNDKRYSLHDIVRGDPKILDDKLVGEAMEGEPLSPRPPKKEESAVDKGQGGGAEVCALPEQSHSQTAALRTCLTAKKVDMQRLRKILEESPGDRSWLDAPLGGEPEFLPSPLIHAIAISMPDVVGLLLEYHADPNKGLTGMASYKGWIKPGLRPSEVTMNRRGRFVGTMLGDKLKTILDFLQAAEVRVASECVHAVTSEIPHAQGHPSEVYFIQGEVGGSATSTTQKGVHKETGELFAIKAELKAEEAGIWEELAIMRKLNNTNIVRLQQTFEDETHVYVVLELCSGGKLFSRMVEAGGSLQDASHRLMRQMVKAVEHLHKQQICHRDIQPENFLLKDNQGLLDGIIKLIDFTEAKEFGPGIAMRVALDETVTVECVAPEIMVPRGGTYSEKVDIWSLGVVFFTMLCGAPPFEGDDHVGILRNIKAGSFDFNPPDVWAKISAQGKDMVSQMLVVDPNVRYSATDVGAHTYLNSEPPKGTATGKCYLTPAQLQTLYTFRSRNVELGKDLLKLVIGSHAGSGTRGSRDIIETPPLQQVSPLANVLSGDKKHVDMKQLRSILESSPDVKTWIDVPMGVEGPSPLIFAIGRTEAEAVALLLEFGADPGKGFIGQSAYCGWIKPGCKLSEAVMNRGGRFIGTMLGDKLKKILEILQEAEAQRAVEKVQAKVVTAETPHTLGHPRLKYVMRGDCGSTESSTTKKGAHRQTGEVFAIKAEDKLEEAALWDEITIMRKLQHPHIIKLQETFEDEKHIYMVLELCSGGELFSSMAEAGGLPQSDAVKLMHQMAAALHYLHGEVGICHRDIRPENFLLKDQVDLSEAVVKLIDFTTAKEFAHSPMTTKICSLHYVAPEIITRSGGAYNEKVDIWSLGVVFYIMLCGSPPFFGNEEVNVLKKIKQGSYSFTPDECWVHITKEKELISDMLVVDANRRASASDVLTHPALDCQRQDTNAKGHLSTDQMGQLRNFHARQRVQKSVLKMKNNQIPEEVIQVIRNIFVEQDKDGTGEVHISVLRDTMRRVTSLRTNMEELMKVLWSLNTGSGTMKFDKFHDGLKFRHQALQKEVCKSVFDVFDINLNGIVTRDELQLACISECKNATTFLKDVEAAFGPDVHVFDSVLASDKTEYVFEDFYSILITGPKSKRGSLVKFEAS